jgi:hypothetical protein
MALLALSIGISLPQNPNDLLFRETGFASSISSRSTQLSGGGNSKEQVTHRHRRVISVSGVADSRWECDAGGVADSRWECDAGGAEDKIGERRGKPADMAEGGFGRG